MNATLVWSIAGWTILHFAWIGGALLIVAGALRWLTSRLPAIVRYGMSLATLSLLAVAPLAIAGWLWWNAPPMEALPKAIPTPIAETGPVDIPSPAIMPPRVIDLAVEEYTPPPESAIDTAIEPMAELTAEQIAGATNIDEPTAWQRAERALSAITEWLPWLWVAGTPVMIVLLCGGLTVTGRLRRSAQAIDRPEINELFDRVRQTLSVARHVTLAVSDRVRTPILVGIVRPLILLPPAVLAGWNAEQLELALLHELAHVRRHDNLVNLLQRMIEAALWFHPAVWVASHWVRRDREECCDRLVVQHSGRPREYAQLLVEVASEYSAAGRPALASAMARGSLHHRVRRILSLPEEPMKVSRMSLLIALAFAIALGVGSLVVPDWSNADDAAKPASGESSEVVEPAETIDVDASEKSGDEGLFQFPTLKEQRDRDLVHELLLFEPEPINDEQAKICRQHKFAGGVLIEQSGSDLIASSSLGKWQPGNILVGLHVWPTPSLDKLVEVLRRDDLLELSPLKTYMLIPFQITENVPNEVDEVDGNGFRGGGMGDYGDGYSAPVKPVTRTEWKLITGRVSINREAWAAEQQRMKPASAAAEQERQTAGQQPTSGVDMAALAATDPDTDGDQRWGKGEVNVVNVPAKLLFTQWLGTREIDSSEVETTTGAVQKATITVEEKRVAVMIDQRTNRLIFSGPAAVIREICKELEQLDATAADPPTAIRPGPIGESPLPETINQSVPQNVLPTDVQTLKTGVLFFSDESEPSRRMAQTIERRNKSGIPTPDVRTIDVLRDRETSRQFSITSVPTCLLVVNGEVVNRRVGAMTDKELSQFISGPIPGPKPTAADPSKGDNSESSPLAPNRRVVFFHSSQSGPSTKMLAKFKSVREAIPSLSVQIVDVAESTAVAMRNKINRVPTLVLVVDNHEIGRHEGSMETDQLIEFLSPVISELDKNVAKSQVESATTSAQQPELQYDGKSFDEWAAYWRAELKAENRTKAVEAFAAFAKAGMAERAMEEMFALAEASREQGTGNLISVQIAGVLTDHFDDNAVMNAVAQRLLIAPEDWYVFARDYLLPKLSDTPDDATIVSIEQLVGHDDVEIRKLGLRAAFAFNRDYQNSRLNKVLIDALSSNDEVIRREPLRFGTIDKLMASDAIDREIKEVIVSDLLKLSLGSDAAERRFGLQLLFRLPQEWQAYSLEVVLSRWGDALKPADSHTDKGIEKLKRLLFVIAAFEKIADEALVEKTATVLRPIVLDEQIDIDTATLAAVAAAIVADDINTNSGQFLHIETDEFGNVQMRATRSPYAEKMIEERVLQQSDKDRVDNQVTVNNIKRIRKLLEDRGEGSLLLAR